jgi:hypothetical protein
VTSETKLKPVELANDSAGFFFWARETLWLKTLKTQFKRAPQGL